MHWRLHLCRCTGPPVPVLKFATERQWRELGEGLRERYRLVERDERSASDYEP